MTRRLAACALVLVALLSLPGGAGAAAPSRVVALEWEYVEDLLALGLTPIGAADIAGMELWTAVDVPDGATDVGDRQEPSLERIAALAPDLIVAPRFRVARNLDQLQRIAPVLLLDAYPPGRATGRQYDATIASFRAIARGVGRQARADAFLRDLDRTYRRLRGVLARAGRSGARVAFAYPGGTTGAPQIRMATGNSLVGGVLRRLGLRNGWPVQAAAFGYSTVGVEGLRRAQDGWLALSYPSMAAPVVDGFTKRNTWKRLGFVRRDRVRRLADDTWPYGGPLSIGLLATRLATALAR